MTADEMPNVYELPDLPFAPASEVQALAVRLIGHADWAALRPLMDRLQEADRYGDLAVLKSWAARALLDYGTRSNLATNHWRNLAGDLVTLFAFDLYTPDAVAAHMGAIPVTQPIYDDVEPMGGPDPWGAGLTAAEDIPAGAAIQFDWTNDTVRVRQDPPAEGGAA